VPIRLIHVSDLHVGAPEHEPVEPALRELVALLTPELIVATGDLTHRGRPAQHEHAAAFLRGLGPPVLAVPGNHDLPYALPARFTAPWTAFERCWETTEPVHGTTELHVVGLNSARPWRHQAGALDAAAIERASGRLAAAADGALRVACLHHHLTGAPWRSRKRPVARRAHVLESLAAAGAELVLSGHIHQSAVSERREFEVGLGPESGVVLAIAPGLGQPRPRRRGEARGLHVVAVEPDAVEIETLVYAAGSFTPIATRRFTRRAR
jgi:3',5'-cyclic AMP phosphodiesterase CpdA